MDPMDRMDRTMDAMDGGTDRRKDVAAEIRAVLAEHERYMRAILATAAPRDRRHQEPPQDVTPADAPFPLLRRAAM